MKKKGIFYGSTNGDTESGKKMYTMSPIQRPMPYNPTKYCY